MQLNIQIQWWSSKQKKKQAGHQAGHSRQALHKTYSCVIKEVEQRNKKGSPVLPIPSDHGVKMGAQSAARFILSKAPHRIFSAGIDCLLYLVRHLHTSHCFHLKLNKMYNAYIFLTAIWMKLLPNNFRAIS